MMTNTTEQHLDKMFHALSDSTRRKMLFELTSGDLNVSELGEPFDLTKQAVSKHLKVLETAGLINKEKDGRVQRCQFDMKNFEKVQSLLDQYKKFWEAQFDGLEKYIEDVKSKEVSENKSKKGEQK